MKNRAMGHVSKNILRWRSEETFCVSFDGNKT